MLALAAVVGISAGQILFKLAANHLQKYNTVLAWVSNPHLLVALTIYGLATVLWVMALQRLALSTAYSIMGLAFVLVPLASYFWLGERLSKSVLIGALLIVAGIVISNRNEG